MKIFKIIYIALLLLLVGCNANIIDPPVEDDSADRKIAYINKVHEDNINGRIIDTRVNLDTNVIDNYRLIYNANGTLNSISVYDDSSDNAILQREVRFVYYTNKVRWYTFNAADTVKYKTVDAYFNAKKQVIRIADTTNNGFNFYYQNDKLHAIEDTTPNTTFLRLKNFVYTDGNLVKYDVFYPNGTPLAIAEMEYTTKRSLSQFDLPLYSSAVVFLYLADLNIISKTGLNYGIGNAKLLKHKRETLMATPQFYIDYSFDYEYDIANPKLVSKRSVAKSGTLVPVQDTAFYQYKY